MVHLLGRCNLTCRHCYMEGSPQRREQLPLEAVLRAVEESAALGVGTLYLTGGEPLLYRGFSDILRASTQIPGLETTVCTNATLVKGRHAELLTDSRARVNVSIDGNEEFHDYFRCLQGAFRAAEDGVRILVDAGLEVTIVTTISQSNLHMLADIAQWAAGIGAAEFRVQPLLRLGRGIGIADQRLTSVQLNELVMTLSDLANRYRPGLKCGVIGVTRRYLLAHPCAAYVCNGAGCHRRVAREIKKVVIREDGTVLPEVTNLSHDFALGNITDGPLSHLVARYFENGYERFDRLCRTTYAETVQQWGDVVVPWDQIVAARSYTWRDEVAATDVESPCGKGCLAGAGATLVRADRG
ncbi:MULTISPECIES: radical SAM protein [unclassified Mycolicibacterium]|nr:MULTISPECIES: radical SAM protein [unclassified Mycolicibacterium]